MMKSMLAAAALAAFGATALAQDKFTVALDGTFAPHAMPKLGGGVEGFNVDLAKEIGKRLDAEMDIVAIQWSGVLPGLMAGTYDFVVAPTTMTEERAANLLFTEGYLNTDYQFAVRQGGKTFATLEDFDGATIAVNKGSSYDSWARGIEADVGWTVESYGTTTDAVQAVLAGRADAVVAGNTVIAWAVQKAPGLQLDYLHPTGRLFGMPFRKEDAALRDKVEAVIECMKIDGTLAGFSEKWFGVTPAEGQAAVTPVSGFGQPGFEGHVDNGHTPAC